MYNHHYKFNVFILFALLASLSAGFNRVSGAIPPFGIRTTASLFATPWPTSAPAGYAAIAGVGARPFDAALWERGALNLVPNAQSPLLDPLAGSFRNIYAPSAVETPTGWRVFFGGWDGTPSGNDHIYGVTTPDFRSFSDRGTLIDPGAFQHVCNVNALQLADGSFNALCTVFPDAYGYNKPAFYRGLTNEISASRSDIAQIYGYGNYAGADVNGMNVLLFDDNVYRMYFCDYRNFTHVYRATSREGMSYTYDGPALASNHNVNDVKKFITPYGPCYLMGLHANSAHTWYSLSRDGMNFAPERPLISQGSGADPFIVALGWVVKGNQEQPGRRLLGLLYGAGANPQLDENRIFARWLQMKLVFVSDDGQRITGGSADGPESQLIPLGSATSLTGTLQVYAEDGKTFLCSVGRVELDAGQAYQLRFSNLPGTFSELVP